MVALLVALSVMGIMMGAALPAWHNLVLREKETELVFRGEQYARAIGLYQRRFANAPAPSIDFLVEQRFLRKKYKDPITNDDFQVLSHGGGGQPGQITDAQRTLQEAAGRLQQAGRAGGGRGAGTPAGQAPGQVAGIVGVTSKSPLKSLRLYNGRDTYNQWVFIPVARGRVGDAGGRAGGGPAGGPAAGQRGDARGGGARGGADGRGRGGTQGDGRGGRQGGRF
jgi:type II secretory pathway pseudopilin PulG